LWWLKRDTRKGCLNQSKREVEKILFEKSSEPAKIASKERVRAVSREFHEIRFLANEEQMLTLERSRELFPDDSLAKLMERALSLLISEKEKQQGKKRNPDLTRKTEYPSAELEASSTRVMSSAPLVTLPAVQPIKSGMMDECPPMGSSELTSGVRVEKRLFSRYIPRHFRRMIH
jgi:hypothetical protein